MTESIVYVVRRGDHVKIGTTISPDRRLADVLAGRGHLVPDEIEGDGEVLSFVPGDRSTERLLHLAFSEQRIGGEWFQSAGPVARFVASLERDARPWLPKEQREACSAYVGIRLTGEALAEVDKLAATEAAGNRSEMLRRLVSEALTARRDRPAATAELTRERFEGST